jgi:uncharacterized protein
LLIDGIFKNKRIMMKPIYIPQLLKALNRKETIIIEDFIKDLPTLTPVRGEILVKHGGNFLEVEINAETIVTLTCDRCSKQYNYRLNIENNELIWLDEKAESWDKFPDEKLELDNLEESLDPQGYFEVENWLYEQLSLALPLQKICDENCPPVSIKPSETEPLIDNRWQSLLNLKENLS